MEKKYDKVVKCKHSFIFFGFYFMIVNDQASFRMDEV